MRSTPLWSAVFLASSASAQTGNPGLPKIGPLKPGIGNTPEALQVSEDAGRKPNDTDLVAFTRMFNGTEEEWTWGINITSFRVPNRIEDLGAPHANDSNGWYITNIQWQLGWPGDKGDSLQGYLADRNMSASFGAMISNKSPGLTEDYHADDNGDCTALLGDDCVRSLAKSASRGDTVQFDSLDGCEDTLDAHGDGDIQSGTAWSVEPADTKPDDRSDDNLLHRDGTLLYRTSDVNGNYSTPHAQAMRAVHILVMGFKFGDGPRGQSSNATVLCRILDRSSYGNAEEPMNAAIGSWAQPFDAILVTVILSTLFIMWV